jgi:hypothetical protein
MKAETQFKFWDFNIWQNISATGLVVTVMSQVGLHFASRSVENFNNLYYVWIGVFVAGAMLKYYNFRNGIEPGHHHHHHD